MRDVKGLSSLPNNFMKEVATRIAFDAGLAPKSRMPRTTPDSPVCVDKPKEVFRVIHRDSGNPCTAYSRACHDEVDFSSPESARYSNVHGIYKDKFKYKVARYRVTYELIEEDVDGSSECNAGDKPLD